MTRVKRFWFSSAQSSSLAISAMCYGNSEPNGSEGFFNEHMQHEGIRPLFQTALELHNTAAAAMMDVRPANFELRPNGHVANLELGSLIIFEKNNSAVALPAQLSRKITAAFSKADSKSPAAADQSGQTNLVKGSVLVGSKDRDTRLILVSNQQALNFCRAHSEHGKGFGRISRKTFGYADRAAIMWSRSHVTSDESCSGDMYGCCQSLLKELSHNVRTQLHEDWEKGACQAAEHGQKAFNACC
jgi:hypothetical protein